MINCDGCDTSVLSYISCKYCTAHYCRDCCKEYLNKVGAYWMHPDVKKCRECIINEKCELERKLGMCNKLLKDLESK